MICHCAVFERRTIPYLYRTPGFRSVLLYRTFPRRKSQHALPLPRRPRRPYSPCSAPISLRRRPKNFNYQPCATLQGQKKNVWKLTAVTPQGTQQYLCGVLYKKNGSITITTHEVWAGYKPSLFWCLIVYWFYSVLQCHNFIQCCNVRRCAKFSPFQRFFL
jgi:hypothetical protein